MRLHSDFVGYIRGACCTAAGTDLRVYTYGIFTPGHAPFLVAPGLSATCRIMKRIIAFTLTTWVAAAILLIGRDSSALVALSGVVVFAGFDLLSP